MKVLFVVPWGERLGGAERRLMTILEAADRTRLLPQVAFLQKGAWVDEVAALDIPVTVIPSGRLRQIGRFVFTIWRLVLLIRREEPDLIFSWSAKMQLYGGTAAALAGYRRHALWWQLNIATGEWMERAATAVPATAIACSSYAAATAQARLRPRRRTFVVHPGIAAPEPAPDVGALRTQLGIPSNRITIGIVGRLQPWKRQHYVLGAVAELHRRGHDVHALVVGGAAYGFSTDYPDMLSSLAHEQGLDGRVTFAGQVDEPGPYIDVMDVVVNASAAEPFGLVLLEGMALAKPVVAYNAGGPQEILENGISGVLIAEGDEMQLAEALEPLVIDPQLRRQIGTAANRRFNEHFSAEKMLAELTTALEDILAAI